MACHLLLSPREKSDQDMIAQPLITTPEPSRPQAAAPTAAAPTDGFQAVLAASTDATPSFSAKAHTRPPTIANAMARAQTGMRAKTSAAKRSSAASQSASTPANSAAKPGANGAGSSRTNPGANGEAAAIATLAMLGNGTVLVTPAPSKLNTPPQASTSSASTNTATGQGGNVIAFPKAGAWAKAALRSSAQAGGAQPFANALTGASAASGNGNEQTGQQNAAFPNPLASSSTLTASAALATALTAPTTNFAVSPATQPNNGLPLSGQNAVSPPARPIPAIPDPSLVLPPGAAPSSGDTPPNGAAANGAATANSSGSSNSANGSQSSVNAAANAVLSADGVNARVAAGAPIYAAQPSAALAGIQAQLLAQAVPHPAPAPAAGTATSGGASGAAGASSTAQKSSVTPPAKAAPSPAVAAPSLPSAATSSTAAASSAASSSAAAASPASSANTPASDTAASLAAASHTITAPPSVGTAPSDSASDKGNSSTAQDGTASATTAAEAANAASGTFSAPANAAPAAPAQTDAAIHTAAPYIPVGEQVALSLKQALTNGNNEIRIQLKPQSLGTIDVKLNLTHDGRVSAVISADRSDTLNMLKQDQGSLQQGLRDAGFNADGSSLSFNLRGDAQSFAQNSSQGGSSHGGNRAYAASTAMNESLAPAASTTGQRLHSGSLDIEV